MPGVWFEGVCWGCLRENISDLRILCGTLDNLIGG